MGTEIIIAIAVSVLATVVVASHYIERRGETKAKKTIDALSEMGTLVAGGRYPQIDPERCIGSGACVMGCPEKGVLAVVSGRGVLVNPLGCVGHGACADACPMEAITLVYGTEEQGLKLPRIDSKHRTNLAGLYIVGELGGMGLIRNAVRQGTEAARDIAARGRRGEGDIYDAIIVGAGPAGISATLGAKEAGLNVLLLDRDALGGTILHYPRAKIVMTGHLALPLFGTVERTTMSKEELVELWLEIERKVGLPLKTGELVEHVEADASGIFEVRSSGGTYRATNVVLALGRRGSPRKLEVEGEEHPKVAYALLEPTEFADKHVLVVGGGNSAVECAIALADAGMCKSVAISYRRTTFARCRGDNREKITKQIETGKVLAKLGTNLLSISDANVVLQDDAGSVEQLPNDAVIVQIGGTPPSQLLESFGIQMVTKRGDE